MSNLRALSEKIASRRDLGTSDVTVKEVRPVEAVPSPVIEESEKDDDKPLLDKPQILEEVDSAPSVDVVNQVMGKKFSELAAHPFPGSLLHTASKPNVRKKDLENYLSRRWGSNVITAVFDPEVAPWTYFLYSIVLPHQSALDIAEEVATHTAKNQDSSEFELLTGLLGRKISNSADIANVARGLVRRSPLSLIHI